MGRLNDTSKTQQPDNHASLPPEHIVKVTSDGVALPHRKRAARSSDIRDDSKRLRPDTRLITTTMRADLPACKVGKVSRHKQPTVHAHKPRALAKPQTPIVTITPDSTGLQPLSHGGQPDNRYSRCESTAAATDIVQAELSKVTAHIADRTSHKLAIGFANCPQSHSPTFHCTFCLNLLHRPRTQCWHTRGDSGDASCPCSAHDSRLPVITNANGSA